MTRSQQLKTYCADNGLTLEKCRQNGRYMIITEERPESTKFCKTLRDLRQIGYEYIQDGQDSSGYFFTIKAS